MVPLVMKSAVAFSLEQLAEIFASAFEGYFVPVSADASVLAARIRQEQVDLAASFVATTNDLPCAISLIARRGAVSRLAGMGVFTPWRGQGIGLQSMQHALGQARQRQDQHMLLEVIEQNEAALALYQSCGFVQTRRLVGYALDPFHGNTDPHGMQPLEIGLAEFSSHLHEHGTHGLPWQLEHASLGAVTPPSRAFKLGPACALVQGSALGIALRSILVPAALRRKGHGRNLLRGLAQQFPNKTWSVSAIVPETLADEFFLSMGFGHQPISQFEMRCALQNPPTRPASR